MPGFKLYGMYDTEYIKCPVGDVAKKAAAEMTAKLRQHLCDAEVEAIPHVPENQPQLVIGEAATEDEGIALAWEWVNATWE